MLATVLSAKRQTRIDGHKTVWELADAFCAAVRQRVEQRLREFRYHQDSRAATTGTQALKGYYPTLSEGTIQRRLDEYIRKKELP